MPNSRSYPGPAPRAAATVLVAACLLGACGEEPPPAWNVLLVTFDTTRADFIGSYGREDADTPTLDGMAARGVLFEQATSSNPVTQPSHSTILTGTYPLTHGVRDNGLFKLPQASETLAEILAARGYRTGAAIGGFPLVKDFGLDQGFEFYDDALTEVRQDHRGRPAPRSRPTWYDERPAGHVNDAILPWLREPSERPFFAWIHYWDPHHPHIAPPPYGQQYAHDPYQGEIAYADRSLGVILRDLEYRGELERTIVVMTSDHGEGRGEHHEETHAFLAYAPTLHVPLIMQFPSAPPGARVVERVGTVDIVPTILDLLDIEPPTAVQGRSLLELVASEPADDPRNRRRYYSESMSPRLTHGFGELRALYWGPYKYIHGPRSELFDLSSDPRELNDLIASEPAIAAEMDSGLVDFVAQHASPVATDATHDFDPRVRQRLAALGYLTTGGATESTVDERLRTDGMPPQDWVTQINLQQRLRRLLSTGQFAAAEATLKELLDTHPAQPFYQAKLAEVYLGLGDVEKAAALVEATEEIKLDHVADYLAVAEALLDSGAAGRGLALAQRIVDAAGTASANLALARIHARHDEAAAALAAIERALALEPDHLDARRQLAQQRLEAGRLDQAEEILTGLLRDYPIDPETNLRYTQLLVARNQPEQALRRVDRFVMLWPYHCELQLGRLELLLDTDQRARVDAARAELEETCRDQDLRARAAELVAARNAS